MGEIDKLVSNLVLKQTETEEEFLNTLVPFSMRLEQKDRIKLNVLAEYFGKKNSPFASDLLAAALSDVLASVDGNEDFLEYLASEPSLSEYEKLAIFGLRVEHQSIPDGLEIPEIFTRGGE